MKNRLACILCWFMAAVLAATAWQTLGGAEEGGPRAVPEADVERAFDVIRRALGERAAATGSLASLATAAAGQPTYADGEVLALLRELSLEARIDKPEWLWTYMAGQHIKIQNMGEHGLRIIHILEGGEWTLDLVNRWNLERRFARCHMDAEGDLWFEMDVPLRGGVSAAYVKECFLLFRTVLQVYLQFLGEGGAEAPR